MLMHASAPDAQQPVMRLLINGLQQKHQPKNYLQVRGSSREHALAQMRGSVYMCADTS